MALYKEVELENGIKLTYHRIRNINIETNVANWVEVTSYIDKDFNGTVTLKLQCLKCHMIRR